VIKRPNGDIIDIEEGDPKVSVKMHKSDTMETINYIFIVPPDDYSDQCHSCLALLKEGMLPSSIRYKW